MYVMVKCFHSDGQRSPLTQDPYLSLEALLEPDPLSRPTYVIDRGDWQGRSSHLNPDDL
uniref:Uncharacterized protein n=2 Tax=Picea TaxID=3328 RepID=A0A124GNF7_PICGL|nr:hypothetical protein ABT39_MTgene4678 [Picea glauca]QHR89775.1 hypothetical protein Q903MT_gene3797 [Picea sitchensis]